MDKRASVYATKITADKSTDIDITKNDFLAASNETPIVKYGFVLQSIIQHLHI